MECCLCKENRVVQQDSSDLGYEFVVFGCYSQYKLYRHNGKLVLINQGNLCKDRQITALKEEVEILSTTLGAALEGCNELVCVKEQLSDLRTAAGVPEGMGHQEAVGYLKALLERLIII